METMTHAAVLESTYRPPTTEPAEVYTTAQEIAWLDDLAKRRRSDVLLNLRAAHSGDPREHRAAVAMFLKDVPAIVRRVK
jgi:hypothetical protein